jgi:spore germination protein GerM
MLPRLYPELIWLKMRNAQELLVEVSDVTSTKSVKQLRINLKTCIQGPDTRSQMCTPQPHKAFLCMCKEGIKIMTLLSTSVTQIIFHRKNTL